MLYIFWRSNPHPLSKLVDKKTMVHLHNRILHSRKKEGMPTFCDSMDGTGEHYAK